MSEVYSPISLSSLFLSYCKSLLLELAGRWSKDGITPFSG